MDGLIEFLFNNIFFVLIVLGFIFSLLQKAGQAGRSQQEGPQSERSRRERTGGGTSPFPSGSPASSDPSQAAGGARQDDRSRSTAAERLALELNRREQAFKRSDSLLANRSKDGLSVTDTSRAARAVQRTAVPTGAGLARPGEQVPGQNELQTAVLWAEILGKPRARRKHGHRQ